MTTDIIKGRHTVDGAGVKLFRVFAHESVRLTDPFLLLDNFGSDNPEDYLKGFPWHPHRGIETVTYMLEGEVEHGDSMGNGGVIRPGEVQWMTAGSGIVHQEMPKPLRGKMSGLQLWVNLPAHHKMMPPRYRGISAREIPAIKNDDALVRVIAGAFEGHAGPVKDLVVDTDYFDVSMEPGRSHAFAPKPGYTTVCYLLEGEGHFLGKSLKEKQLFLVKDSASLSVEAGKNLRFMYVSGKPLDEPIAWGGPIVMNSQAELDDAFRELEQGSFIKK